MSDFKPEDGVSSQRESVEMGTSQAGTSEVAQWLDASNAWSLAEAQCQVDQWIQTIGVRYFSELTNLAQLMEEVGEVARVISRRYGDQSSKPSDQAVQLSDEMADVLFVLICLANQTGVDLGQALKRNLDKKTHRDRNRHRDNPKLREG